MWHLFERDEHDAAEAAAASRGEAPTRRPLRAEWFDSLSGTLQASATRRALLLTALGGLLIAGLVTALPIGGGPGRLAGYIDPVPPTGAKGNDAFNRAASGNCLMWPDRMPEAANIVDCKDEHRFEVAESIDMRTFPGSEYGPYAPPPTGHPHPADQPGTVRVVGAPLPWREVRPEQQVRHQHAVVGRQGVAAVRRAADAVRTATAGRGQPAGRLQGQGRRRRPVQGLAAGTCLGIDPATNQPTDIPVDCAAPHAMEVTGTVNLLARFPEGAAPRARAGRVHQGLLHQADRRLPGAGAVAQHDADADLQHAVAAELVGRQPPGGLQHRRDAGQRRLGDAAEQRQGRH